jgi:hypothetical protein
MIFNAIHHHQQHSPLATAIFLMKGHSRNFFFFFLTTVLFWLATVLDSKAKEKRSSFERALKERERENKKTRMHG